MPWGLLTTGKVIDWALSSSFNSSMEFDGSRDTITVFSPTVVGFQYRTTSTMSPLSMLGRTISSLREPSSYRAMARFDAARSPSFRISVRISRKVLT